MKRGHNYLAALEAELTVAREETVNEQKAVSGAESRFLRALPPDENIYDIREDTLGRKEVREHREAFRAAHAKLSLARSWEAEIEDELFEFPEDRH